MRILWGVRVNLHARASVRYIPVSQLYDQLDLQALIFPQMVGHCSAGRSINIIYMIEY